MQTVCVIGLGYIGLPTASLLATKGFTVRGVDVKPSVVETINQGKIHIHEPDLDVLVKAAVQSGNLRASTEPAPADVFIIAVPTPFCSGHTPDLTYIEAASSAIAPHLRPGNLVILESTSPVGTTEKIGAWFTEQRPDLTISTAPADTIPCSHPAGAVFLAHCPERVLPGQVLKELVENDRIIGGVDPPSAHAAQAFYEQFVKGAILITDARTAELSKLTENSFRDVNIAFANELSMICDRLNVNVWDVIELSNRHPRVNILKPGPGVGGHCIAVDPWFIVDSAPEQARLIRTAREINDHKPHYVVAQVKEKADRFKHPKIACLGLAFKANIDDLRESPAVEIVVELANEQVGSLLVVEPFIDQLPECLSGLDNVKLGELYTSLADADIVLLLVDHSQFSKVKPEQIRDKIVLDTRGSWRHIITP